MVQVSSFNLSFFFTVSDVKSSPSLEIVSLPASGDPPKRPDPDPGSKRAKLFPEVFSNETEVCRSFATELIDYLDRQDDQHDQVKLNLWVLLRHFLFPSHVFVSTSLTLLLDALAQHI